MKQLFLSLHYSLRQEKPCNEQELYVVTDTVYLFVRE
jgi:hypothetical protein